MSNLLTQNILHGIENIVESILHISPTAFQDADGEYICKTSRLIEFCGKNIPIGV